MRALRDPSDSAPISCLAHRVTSRRRWALWAGTPWPLDMSIFTPKTQTDEFDQTRNNTGNPICGAPGSTCGSAADGQTIVCCSGTCSSSSFTCQ